MAQRKLGARIGVATIDRRRMIKEAIEVAIVELLPNSGVNGCTHVLVAGSGETVGYLVRDESGQYLVDHLIVPGEVTGFFLDEQKGGLDV